jgi:hypothetical protein
MLQKQVIFNLEYNLKLNCMKKVNLIKYKNILFIIK